MCLPFRLKHYAPAKTAKTRPVAQIPRLPSTVRYPNDTKNSTLHTRPSPGAPLLSPSIQCMDSSKQSSLSSTPGYQTQTPPSTVPSKRHSEESPKPVAAVETPLSSSTLPYTIPDESGLYKLNVAQTEGKDVYELRVSRRRRVGVRDNDHNHFDFFGLFDALGSIGDGGGGGGHGGGGCGGGDGGGGGGGGC
ncbi:hypothetical protein BKA56DRAFT_595711 [Ilyonectria sp. MPI-CAGE-AT-0026]|nr:hypothetical protein BKA56DRAFT_595711 [Ilyonectria sp. MPI-CAGE-AT-0026]